MVYTVLLTEAFEREFSRKHKDKKDWLLSVIEKLEQNPEHGKPLSGRLFGLWQVRMGPFRVWYEINDIENVVLLKAILHKDEAVQNY